MHVQGFLARPTLLISAMVGFWLSAGAHAEVAGRVNFVSGEVTAIQPDNSKRLLARGDSVNSGERLETGDSGRIQLRLTDGGFLALQPKTVFSLDSYSYSRDKPDQSTLVFNFLRGSMRTISGAIGKANRSAYQIKTPAATIGIRGTDYAGVLLDNQLLLKVMEGIVNLNNALGNADVAQGQTYWVSPGSAPALFIGTFPAELDAIEPEAPASSAGAASAAAKALALAAPPAGAAALTDLPERPRLENYENYNQFLQAMYAFKKAEALRNQTAQPTAETPVLDLEKIRNMPMAEADLETETVESKETPSLVTEGPESIETAVERAREMKLPRYTPGENYHRSTFKSFPLAQLESPTLETASIDDSFRLGVTSTNLLLGQMADREDNNEQSRITVVRPDLANKQMTILLERRNYSLYLFGNLTQITGVDDMEISWIIRD
jgi:hypothetical protein